MPTKEMKGIIGAKLESQAKRIDELERLATQRGARMQVMREWMQQEDMPRFSSSWREFLRHYPEAADWFDEDGVPVREGK